MVNEWVLLSVDRSIQFFKDEGGVFRNGQFIYKVRMGRIGELYRDEK
jgi:hypothetical protein